ncbi:hypothetical protein N7509_011162 [Penicillium cosmopolitanum]|uniref:DUF6604 domain-containing protein n=1 Tax=Penicillium cosmopolitanum TaxID=1131564 RepID=A0A9W9VSP2_9EURO|nr:uncharacterized protein N7509_011162 [Penicillium cosmopolitanum]KAJ5388621.1 hypothetical protein N7509_011162 [Penicillium cosmopolitanum]
MLPKSLQSSYIRYKNDTNSFATWLFEAASKCGHQPSNLAAIALSLNETENKKNNKRKHKKNRPSEAHGSIQYITTVRDLQVLAEAVAESTLPVPKQVISIVKRAIKLRKQVTSWFLEQGESENNKRHVKFISALEATCETLERKTAKPSNRDAQQSHSPPEVEACDADLETFMNKFSVLTVEEPQDSQGQGQFVSSATLKLVKVELDESDEGEAAEAHLDHILFKAFCLFHDLHDMRTFISDTWLEYCEKKIDLMNAAVVTNSTLQLAQDMLKELVHEWDTCETTNDKLQWLVFKTVAIAQGSSTDPAFEIGPLYNEKMADVANWCYLPTLALLDSLAEILPLNHLPVFTKGCLSTNPKATEDKRYVDQKRSEDQIILCQLLPEFCLLSRSNIRILAMDAISEGLTEFCKTKKVTPWLCFATQILLDVHHTMRQATPGAFEDLRISGLRMSKYINEYWKLSNSHPQPKFWPKEMDEKIRRLQLSIDYWITPDPIYLLKCSREMLPGEGMPKERVLFSQHAILCGLTMFHLNIRMQALGKSLVSSWYDVQPMAFLYNLVKQGPFHKDLSWPDMEAFIKIHGESHIFIGSRPKDRKDSLKRLQIASGMSSATQFARNRRKEQDSRRPKGKNPKPLEPITPISTLFRGLYIPWIDGDSGIKNIYMILDKLSKESGAKGGNKALRNSKAQRDSIDTIQLLTLIKSKLIEEEPMILFNYFGMHSRSLELLRQIQAKEHDTFVYHFASDYMPNQLMLPYIVLLIHIIVSNQDECSNGLKLSSRFPELLFGSRIMMSCGNIMREYLQKNGDVACKELKAFCKNKTPIV